jgi:hypothetical protein
MRSRSTNLAVRMIVSGLPIPHNEAGTLNAAPINSPTHNGAVTLTMGTSYEHLPG